ncbi:MAG: HD domain-containing protein [Ignavibacteriaceae bacterium]|nr:HD domain-containing protein [Ignavibacteriaceae bacterium]
MGATENTTGKKQDYKSKKEKFLHHSVVLNDPDNYSLSYSLMTEDHVRSLAENIIKNSAVISAGSFCRRELSPYSDIDIIFLVEDEKRAEEEIKQFVTKCWDDGIEISHTLRTREDIRKYLDTDLHTFTQFFETRFITGDYRLYDEWNKSLLSEFTPDVQEKIFYEFQNDRKLRYKKYGNSPKLIEPNIKYSAGGLRDLQFAEWVFILQEAELLNKQEERMQAEIFVDAISRKGYTSEKECRRILQGFRLLLYCRNLLHILHKRKHDRLEAEDQLKIARKLELKKDGYRKLMRDYYDAANVIYRFARSITKRFNKIHAATLPDALAVDIDSEFVLKGKIIYYKDTGYMNMSSILRAFYYRGKYSAHFDEGLRMLIVDSIDEIPATAGSESSTFFREILNLPSHVGTTLGIMSELGVLNVFMPEFGEMNGFIQHGVYHYYTADEHTLKAISNIEALENDGTVLGKVFRGIKRKDILFLALLFHDIAKPVNIAGHEILGGEIARSVMDKMGYSDEEIDEVVFLVRNHMLMEHVAFRRNLNDPETLNKFSSRFNSIQQLNYLYLLTFADLSAVNPALWNNWKHEVLNELYRKCREMLEQQLTGEELLFTTYIPDSISRHSEAISDDHVQEHLDSMTDLGYITTFSEEEIAAHIEEIIQGDPLSLIFREAQNYTNLTIITRDAPSLLTKICGVLSINDVNIHDAKIFTRRDGIVIDNFNLSDFRTQKPVDSAMYEKIEEDMRYVLNGEMQLTAEIKKMKTRWWRIENKFFKKEGQPRIKFEEHDRYTIIDVFSPDRLGFLYQVTRTLHDLGLNIFFAKIATTGDEIVDAFYVLTNDHKKISPNFYPIIETQLLEAIHQIL